MNDANKARRLACVGAVIVIAALGIGFSLQALVVYPLQAVPVGNSSIARTNYDLGNTASKSCCCNFLGFVVDCFKIRNFSI